MVYIFVVHVFLYSLGIDALLKTFDVSLPNHLVQIMMCKLVGLLVTVWLIGAWNIGITVSERSLLENKPAEVLQQELDILMDDVAGRMRMQVYKGHLSPEICQSISLRVF